MKDMTRETVERANDIIHEIEWCERMRHHIHNLHKVDFRVTTADSHDILSCPDWMRDIISIAIEGREVALKHEFDQL